MSVIDVDPELLRRAAAASLHAAEQTRVHIDAEIVGRVPELMDTLVERGPYAYTILPEIRADGTVRAPVLTTWDEINEAYALVRGRTALLLVEPLVEVRGTWYTFQEALSSTRVRETGALGAPALTLVIFPVSNGTGILGELVWPRVVGRPLGRDRPAVPVDPFQRRRDTVTLHDQYLDAIRVGDVEKLLDTLNPDAHSDVRDYVNDTGTLIELSGLDEHRAYYEAFFERFEIRSVERLDRLVEDWYVFNEFRVTAVPRTEADGQPIAFHIAEYLVLGDDGKFIIRIGHGTDPA
jgi:hypothetical protein